MSLPRACRLRFCGFCGGVLVGFLAYGQTNDSPTSVDLASTNTVPASQMPSLRTPIDFFRQLLAMDPAERKQFLADRSPESRKQILAKVREYEGLKADHRELRLRATELRWYIWPLINTQPTNRTAALAMVPEEDRKLVLGRLQEWDKLPPSVQKELLDNEAAIRYFAEVEGRSEEQKKKMLENISPARRTILEAGVAQWQRLPEPERRKLLNQFNKFFELTNAEKQKALRTLSEPERAQIEKTLRRFVSLPADQRADCIRSFEKFAQLSLEERQQFLKNAERWKLMSPEERQAWRDLVAKLPPPMPTEPPPFPPRSSLPASTLQASPNAGTPLATNSGGY